MFPNFIWFAVPAPNDVLRNDSVTPIVDTIASFFQVIMTAALCIVINIKRDNPMKNVCKAVIAVFVLAYFCGWVLYYIGVVNSAVIILELCVAPCAAFLAFSIARKNVFSLISASVFSVCHLIYGVVNFL